MNLKQKFEQMGWTFYVANLHGECTIWFASPRMNNCRSILKDSHHLNEHELWNSMTEEFIFNMESHAYADYFIRHVLDKHAAQIRKAIIQGEPEFTLKF